MKDFADRALVFICAALMLLFGVGIYVLPSEDFSERENRALADFPKFTFATLTDGSFARALGSFYGDRFLFREELMEAKAALELGLLRFENNGVLLCENGALIALPEQSDHARLAGNLRAISEFCERQESAGVRTAFCVAPRSIDVFCNSLPALYPYGDEGEVYEILRKHAPRALDSREELAERALGGEEVWFYTDHHATVRGAYVMYEKIIASLGGAAFPRESFSAGSVSEGFLGSSASRLGKDAPRADTIELMRYEGDGEYLCFEHETGRSHTGLYRFEYLSSRDKYSVFLGGNYGRLGIYHTSDTEREKLLIVKDSFANACVPYLARHYDIELVDLRYFKGRLSAVIEECEPSAILVMYGMQTLESEGSIEFISR